MDFGTLLHVARKNSETNKNEGKFYSTKFSPPKKESKDKKLSDNIQKFLQKREQEEKERQREQKAKLNSLLALRDEKSKNKIKKMLKVTKSANKSVLDDAINTEHTAVTMEGPEQPDQDDYGYVSKEANAFYQKYIEKVKDVQEDKGFAPSRPHSLKDLSGTKERVKAAITREIDDKKNPTRQRISTATTSSSSSSNISSRSSHTAHSLYDPEAEAREAEKKKREEALKKAKSRKPAPPIMDFNALMKLAAMKQHEPVEALQPVKVKKQNEPERLLTLKEKQEWEERQQAKEARARRDRERNEEHLKSRKAGATPQPRIPKLNQANKAESTAPANASTAPANASTAKKNTIQTCSQRGGTAPKKSIPSVAPSAASTSSKTSASQNHTKSASSLKSQSSSNTSGKSTASLPSNKNPSSVRDFPARDNKLSKSKPISPAVVQQPKSRQLPAASVQKTKQLPIANVQKTRQFPPLDVEKTRKFPPADVQKTRQFPPPDIRRGASARPTDNRNSQIGKRRILDDDDDDDEYDSELDDFIDDGDCEEDYSSHIKAIFGYDKSKYRDVDDDDDLAMESNFAQVQREEFLSKKIGMQEDLEDMKMEALEKKRKIASKKRRLYD